MSSLVEWGDSESLISLKARAGLELGVPGGLVKPAGDLVLGQGVVGFRLV